MSLVFASAVVYMLCLSVPIIIVEQITGLWSFLERAADDYLAQMANDPTPASIYEWAQSYQGQGSVSLATWLFLLLVPGPLTLGLSAIWLRVVRKQESYPDMVLSGFGNFFRAMLLHFTRSVFMALWAILFIIPGIVAYYRYSLAFFLLIDNPDMAPLAAISLSKYYMRANKGNRFFLDLSFLGWFALAAVVLAFASGYAMDFLNFAGVTSSLFLSQLVTGILGSVIFAPVYAYRGVAAAEFYHRVICRDPASFKDPLKLPVK